jgi:hypothetical protein
MGVRVMTTDSIVYTVLGHVHDLLKQQPCFAHTTRDDLDNNILADLERDLHRTLDDLDVQHEREIEREIRWAREEWEQEAAKATKPKKAKQREAAA